MRKAIEEDGIVPYFQPIYNLHTQKIEKYECLVRIVQKDGNIILPYEFLDIAIKSKQYFNITRNMITKSLELFKDKEYECSINLAVDDILNADIVAFIKQSIKNFPNPEKIVFEILEYDEIKNYDEIKKFIEQIHALGCKFAIDDFGSGYSNFTHIYELNIDFIKIDASLIKNIYNDKKSQIITKAIIDFASSLNIITIAEFVEDKKSLELLRKLGVDFIQGYYIGKPSDKII
ncbi:MAG: EAL domain-containing protein [Campylobacteraceae bacterium]|nr:EAL domain-containing protein [Campylobacteraceae bacterium]